MSENTVKPEDMKSFRETCQVMADVQLASQKKAIEDRLLDHFAAVALSGIVANPDDVCVSMKCEDVAKLAYDLAEAMMAERKARRE